MASNLYHSKLVELCGGKPLQLMVKTDRLKSKYSKPGALKPDYVGLKIGQDEYSYSVENEACAVALTGLKGKTVSIIASGSRDDAAIVVVGGPASHTPPPQGKGAAPAQQQQQAPAAGNKDAALANAKAYLCRNGALAGMALQLATQKKAEWEAEFGEQFQSGLPDEVFAVFFTSCLWGINNVINHQDLPMNFHFVPLATKGAAK